MRYARLLIVAASGLMAVWGSAQNKPVLSTAVGGRTLEVYPTEVRVSGSRRSTLTLTQVRDQWLPHDELWGGHPKGNQMRYLAGRGLGGAIHEAIPAKDGAIVMIGWEDSFMSQPSVVYQHLAYIHVTPTLRAEVLGSCEPPLGMSGLPTLRFIPNGTGWLLYDQDMLRPIGADGKLGPRKKVMPAGERMIAKLGRFMLLAVEERGQFYGFKGLDLYDTASGRVRALFAPPSTETWAFYNVIDPHAIRVIRSGEPKEQLFRMDIPSGRLTPIPWP